MAKYIPPVKEKFREVQIPLQDYVDNRPLPPRDQPAEKPASRVHVIDLGDDDDSGSKTPGHSDVAPGVLTWNI